MVIIRAEYLIAHLLIALANKHVYEVSLDDVYKFGKLVQSYFTTDKVLVMVSKEALLGATTQEKMFQLDERDGKQYVKVAYNSSINNIKARYWGYLHPDALYILSLIANGENVSDNLISDLF